MRNEGNEFLPASSAKPADSHPWARGTQFRPGFTFIEVLFAVILMGIGFIMIAGVFPVALLETQATVNDNSGTLVAQDAVNAIQAAATNSLLPATTNASSNTVVVPFPAAMLNAISNAGFATADRRFGWTGFYRRFGTDPYAQVFLIGLANPDFLNPYFTQPPAVPPNTVLMEPPSPSPILAQIAYSQTTGSSYIILNNPNVTLAQNISSVPNAMTGAYVLVADDANSMNATELANHLLVGRIFRLGAQLAVTHPVSLVSPLPTDLGKTSDSSSVLIIPQDPNSNCVVFQLEPGMDLTVDTNSPNGAYAPEATIGSGTVTVYLIGRAPTLDTTVNINTFDGPFTGPLQDISYLSTYIRMNN